MSKLALQYQPSRSPLLRASQRFGIGPIGRWAISKTICSKAPYFSSISPQFTELHPGHVEASIKNRRKVRNHIGSVHAIAMCNLAELVAGTCMELSVSAPLRWIPVGMHVRYQNIARTDLRAVCRIEQYQSWQEGDHFAPVQIFDRHGTEVFSADIEMRLSRRKPETEEQWQKRGSFNLLTKQDKT